QRFPDTRSAALVTFAARSSWFTSVTECFTGAMFALFFILAIFDAGFAAVYFTREVLSRRRRRFRQVASGAAPWVKLANMGPLQTWFPLSYANSFDRSHRVSAKLPYPG